MQKMPIIFGMNFVLTLIFLILPTLHILENGWRILTLTESYTTLIGLDNLYLLFVCPIVGIMNTFLINRAKHWVVFKSLNYLQIFFVLLISTVVISLPASEIKAILQPEIVIYIVLIFIPSVINLYALRKHLNATTLQPYKSDNL
jgi:putative effector of murein hydrolase LrgA (UPF0299 family)